MGVVWGMAAASISPSIGVVAVVVIVVVGVLLLVVVAVIVYKQQSTTGRFKGTNVRRANEAGSRLKHTIHTCM